MKIEFDVIAELQPNGISRQLYIDDVSEPCYTEIDSWEEIVERHIGYYIRPISQSFHREDVKELKQVAKGLERAAKFLRKEIKKYDITG